MHALHDVPMITLYIHKRVIWHVFNLLQCAIFCNFLDMLAKLWKIMVGKVPVINQLTCTFNLVLFSDILIAFILIFVQFWLALTLWQLGLFNSFTKGKRMWLFLTPFLNRGGVFCLNWYRLDITTPAIGHIMISIQN